MIIKKKVKKTAKGYRLKPVTHSLIKEIQSILQTDQDTVIAEALKIFKIELKKKKLI